MGKQDDLDIKESLDKRAGEPDCSSFVMSDSLTQLVMEARKEHIAGETSGPFNTVGSLMSHLSNVKSD